MVKKVPKRLCIACREMFEKKDLHRIVRTPEQEIAYDPAGKKPGKGAYVCSSPECLKKVRKSRLFDKQLKCSVPSEIYDQLEEVTKDE